jgi:hypothetical protein
MGASGAKAKLKGAIQPLYWNSKEADSNAESD